MAIPTALKTRIQEINSRVGPDDVERHFVSLGLRADPKSAKDILLRYAESRGLDVSNFRVRGVRIIDIRDDDFYVLPRLFYLFVSFFRSRRYPRLEESP